MSTFHMNTQDVVSMVQGNLLPPRPQILSSTIAVTFVGKGNLRDCSMPSMLTVSRNHVRNALNFLRRENPLYQHIEISEENLNMLPEGGVPEEIMHVVQQSEDVEALEQERAGYVPEDDLEPGEEDENREFRSSTLNENCTDTH